MIKEFNSVNKKSGVSLFVALFLISALFITVGVKPARAADTIAIDHPETIKYAISDNKVYLRNLNDYDSTWLGCCYNYYFDLTTDGGKAMFSTFLSYRLAGQRLVLYKTSWTIAGPIDIVGSF
jgi:hypothetical protein